MHKALDGRLDITKRIVLFFWLSIGIFCQGYAPVDSASATGVVRLEGAGIEYIELQKENGGKKRLKRPGKTFTLEAGYYRLNEVGLKGGFVSRYRQLNNLAAIEVTEQKQAELKVGGPLEQKIKVNRRGNFLNLDYSISGIGGEEYVQESRGEAPMFIVFKGDEQIASGRFRYG
jgi:hypothetical protein